MLVVKWSCAFFGDERIAEIEDNDCFIIQNLSVKIAIIVPVHHRKREQLPLIFEGASIVSDASANRRCFFHQMQEGNEIDSCYCEMREIIASRFC